MLRTCITTLTATAALASAQPEPPVPASPAMAECIESALAPLKESGVPRFEIGIVKNGTLHVHSIGADATPDSPPERDLFHAASLTKPIAAWIVADMAAEGLIDLDAPAIEGHAPTWRQLVTHTSGLPTLPPGFTDTSDYSAEQLLEGLGTADPSAHAGSFRYSTMGYAVLGYAIERAIGDPFAAVAAERLFTSLGMTSASCEPGDEDELGYAVAGHDFAGNPVQRTTRSPVFIASGGLHVSVADMLQFLAMLTDPAEANADATAIMFADEESVASFPGSVAGFGWQAMPQAGFFWHAGNGPGHHSFAAIHPESGTAVLVMTNRAASQQDPRLAIAAFGLLGNVIAGCE